MMAEKSKRVIWQQPWGYRESVAVVGGVVAIGFLLQLVTGPFDFYLLAGPVNLVLLTALVGCCAVMEGMAHRSGFVRWLSGGSIAVSLILTLLILTLIMGLTPQSTNKLTADSLLGFDAMTCSWPFVLVYFLTLLSLGILIARRLVSFRWKDYAFYLNHLGLWLFLAASGLGYADMERYVMYVREGETEWRVYDEKGNIKELPVAIHLNDFDMDVYPPGLAVIDRLSGEIQAAGEPSYFQIDEDSPNGKLNGWNVEVKQYIHRAVRNSDSTYREVPMPGAAPAALVRAVKGGEIREGWICGGNQAQLYMALPLDGQYSMVMTTAEPRSFMSDIEVYTRDGIVEQTVLEVNKPLRIGAWTLYQYGYDNNAGRLSAYSSFELVYDPWLFPVYAGIVLMMLGSVAMLCTGKNRTDK